MQITLLKDAYLDGRGRNAGEVVDIDDLSLAQALIDRGTAENADGNQIVTEVAPTVEAPDNSLPLDTTETQPTVVQPTPQQIEKDLQGL